ncbi:MAG: alanine racemase [Synergistaceae bacterium]|jgi:alanine racemase|nr:alanine racemase [Synergistaceae bacterium]
MIYEAPTRMEISLDNAAHNWHEIEKLVGDRTIYPVIKKDAYGHGAVRLSRLYQSMGCKNFAVARLEEAIALREAGMEESILVLGQVSPDSVDVALHYDVTCTCAEMAYAEALSRVAAARGTRGKIHVKIDTGMGRLGFKPQEFESYADKLFSLPGIDVEGIYTHFALADEEESDYTDVQFGRFQRTLAFLERRGLTVRVRHVCNSAGILRHPDKYLDAVRPGILLYGVSPLPVLPEGVELKPIFSFKTVVESIHDTEAGSGISYGLRYIAKRKERTAVIPVGYGDGWTRTLSLKTEVLIRGKRCPVLGTICMDHMMVDVTDLDHTELGDEVVLVGTQGEESITIEEIASLRGTIPYEIPLALTESVRRVYV